MHQEERDMRDSTGIELIRLRDRHDRLSRQIERLSGHDAAQHTDFAALEARLARLVAKAREVEALVRDTCAMAS
jgi:predicted  nucleic acid-binding Zn-ribbon protein